MWRALAAASLLLACDLRTARQTTVSGKTVYRRMGVEGVAVEVWRLEASRWARLRTVRSGYHGSFAARLRPGRYRLVAAAELPAPGAALVPLRGALDGLEVAPGTKRIDRLVVDLTAEGEYSSSPPASRRVGRAHQGVGEEDRMRGMRP